MGGGKPCAAAHGTTEGGHGRGQKTERGKAHRGTEPKQAGTPGTAPEAPREDHKTRPGRTDYRAEGRRGGRAKGAGAPRPAWGQNTPRQPPAKARTTRDRAGGGAGPRGPKGAPQWPNKRRYRGGEEADPRQRNHAPRADPRALRGNYGAKGGAPRTGPLRATSPGPERQPHSAGPSPATADAAAGAVRSPAEFSPNGTTEPTPARKVRARAAGTLRVGAGAAPRLFERSSPWVTLCHPGRTSLT